jgi:hypothetical protein
MGWRALVGHGGALIAQDRGSEAMWAAVDGGQEWRRGFGERPSSGEKNALEKKCGNKQTRSQSSRRACFKAQSGTVCASRSWQRR